MSDPRIHRIWAMPNAETFSVPPIGEFVRRYLHTSKVSIDPFARNKRWATYTNDLNPETQAEYHMDVLVFAKKLLAEGKSADLLIFDPPYSPTQIKMSYESIGLKNENKDFQRVGDGLTRKRSSPKFYCRIQWSSHLDGTVSAWERSLGSRLKKSCSFATGEDTTTRSAWLNAVCRITKGNSCDRRENLSLSQRSAK